MGERRTVYLNDNVVKLIRSNSGVGINYSDLLARAVRDLLTAADAAKTKASLTKSSQQPSNLERKLKSNFGLVAAITCETDADDDETRRQALGEKAAEFVDQHLIDEAHLSVAGGRQVWAVVQNLAPRNLRVQVSAMGLASTNSRVFALHPSTHATVAWLRYNRDSQAFLVGAEEFNSLFQKLQKRSDSERRRIFVIASCAPLDEDHTFRDLIGGEDGVSELRASKAIGDFGYIFLDEEGKSLPLPARAVKARSLLDDHYLHELARRDDAYVICVAGGKRKWQIIAKVLRAGLCNVLVTDTETAQFLVDK